MNSTAIETLQGQFSFADPDWKNLGFQSKRILNKRRGRQHDYITEWADDNMEDVLMLVFSLSYRPKVVFTDWETPVMQTERGGRILGHVDLMAKYKERDGPVLFEVKKKIDSLGDLFRQVQRYRVGYLGGDGVWRMPIVIVSPDETDAQRIRQQGYYFLKYDPKMIFAMGGV